jgi:hypothetical protein
VRDFAFHFSNSARLLFKLLLQASFIGSEKWVTVFARKENVGKENKSLIPLLFSFPTFSFLASARETNRYLEYETCPSSASDQLYKYVPALSSSLDMPPR